MPRFSTLLAISLIALNSNSIAQEANTPQPTDTAESTEQEAPRFPRKLALADGVATIYEPQIDSHQGFRSVDLWTAVKYQSNDEKVDMVGALKIRASITVDFDERLVTVYDREILESYFPELEADDADAFSKQLQSNFNRELQELPLDVLLAYLATENVDEQSVDVSMDPPQIIYSNKPALLVNIDGAPAIRPLQEDSKLGLVVNSSWDLFHHKKSDTYYLLMGRHWLKSKKLEGPWKNTTKLPKEFEELPSDPRFDSIRKAVPGDWIASKEIPQIHVATQPTELIVTEGEPTLEAIDTTPLFFVSNTSHDIIYDNKTQSYYLLTSGRWFTTDKLSGDWEGTTELPDYFLDIPEDHERAHVRASISGTIESRFAVLEAQAPKTAVVARDLEAPETVYMGEPVFDEIENTNVSFATNTEHDVFLIDGSYYLCHNAVWFVGENPQGPWVVADHVPDAIYQIPPSSPSYNVTYVKIDDSTPTHVHCSYTSGYHHSYISWGVVVYGSGYHWHHGWWGWGWGYYDPFYPYPYWGYYPHYPYTYGSASFYNPRTGRYGHGHYTYGPYGGAWAGERYNPRTGRYGSGEMVWDYNSRSYSGRSYNPRNGISTSTRQDFEYHGHNEYESWGKSKVQRGDDWIKSERYSNQDGSRYRFESSKGGQGGRIVTDNGRRGGLYQTGDGDLYASKNGRVYRKTDDGWEKRDGGSWNQLPERDFDRDSITLTDQQRDKLSNREPLDRSQFDRSQFEREQIQRSQIERDRERFNNPSRHNRELRDVQRDSRSRHYGNQRARSFEHSRGNRSFNRSGGGLRRRR
ncbi:hypothetical protein [Pelagicoccus mobilis]|uniref:Carbohydrate-binding family V/XII n=1 Tax=Pelagicoccus mobilis TaxID=415221 RepID=A0A934RYI8_9BACT|nr:hypothetical protein [Pelagicoccus mobilis]MBK1877604.1 hypothetical protein [Pelagicoccus mobilis]